MLVVLMSFLGLKLPTLTTLPSQLTGGPDADDRGRFGGGGYGASLKACADVLRRPQDASSWMELGTLLHGKGRLDAAILALQRSVAISPRDAEAHVALAEVLRAAGRFPEAFASLCAAEAVTGDRNQALCYYGYASLAVDQLQRPKVDFQMLAERLNRVSLIDVADAEECERVIAIAEEHNAAKGGWSNRQPRFAPAGTAANEVRAPDMLIADEPRLLEWLNSKCEEVIMPALEAQFGLAPHELWLYDTFLLKFSGTPGERGLGVHVDDDGLGLSFNILLSDPADFEGGGTCFVKNSHSDETVYTPNRGQMLAHYGGLRHASVPCTGGVRYIMVGFIRAMPLVELAFTPDAD